MSSITRWLFPLLAGLALMGCREFELPLSLHTSTARSDAYQSGPYCGPVIRPLIDITSTVPYAKDTVLAGFRSDFFPGAQPFPCNRLTAYRSQGVMVFTGRVPEGVPLNVMTALLEISAFSPTVPIRVTEARPLSTGTTGTYSGATRESCRFRVTTYPRTPYVPGPSNYGGAEITTAELTDAGTDRFWVPLRGPQSINVTEEFRRGVIGSDVVLRLAIEPDDRAIPSGATNNCYGQFTVRLLLLAPDA
jgi:hypothetical protein